jgi:hypothetical protein
MPICSRCGSEIEFRYIDGRCVPLHLYGGGCSGAARSDVYDYAGYNRSKESCCFLTNCPDCGRNVYFIRHNGGSVWIDPPLGPPWFKHPCMDNTYASAKGIRSSVVAESALAKFRQRDGLIIGVVKEAEATASKRCSLINIETGSDKSIILLMKNNAGFLVGRLVLYDQHGKSVSWIENDRYTFRVIVRLKPRHVWPGSLALLIECPECINKITASDISEHLKRYHSFPRTIELDRVTDQPPLLRRDRGDLYEVEKPTSRPIGPMGAPCYRPWDFEAKGRPSKDELAKHLEYLSAHWADVAGSIATVTQPLIFTGKKGRRLLVCAERTAAPPWGGWTYRSPDQAKRRTFTRFRSAVNKAITPHEVDHIEFVTEESSD